jgi:hypothetical protein
MLCRFDLRLLFCLDSAVGIAALTRGLARRDGIGVCRRGRERFGVFG